MTQEKKAVDPSNLPSNLSEASLFWFKLGYEVVPIVPKQKRPSVKLTDWLSSLSEDSIRSHWEEHPDHEIAIHCGSSIMVLDADSRESEEALHRIEREHLTPPWMSIRTAKGVHHYFRLAEGVRVQAAGYGSEAPEKIDIRHGQNSIALIAPSTDKVVESTYICSPMQLYDVTQDFVNSIVTHNGGLVREGGAKSEDAKTVSTDLLDHESFTIPFDQELVLDRVKDILTHLDPDLGYSDWIRILAAVFNSTQGSDEGLELVDSWSSRGSKYPGVREVTNKWLSFRSDYEAKANFRTLLEEVQRVKPNWIEERSELEDPFEVIDDPSSPPLEDGSASKSQQFSAPPPDLSQSGITQTSAPKAEPHWLASFSIANPESLKELEKNVVPLVPLLGPIVMDGQYTVIYAPSNSGKTLLTLYMVRQGIIEKRFDPSRIYHANFDDTGEGNHEKGKLAQSFGFHSLVPGYKDISEDKIKELMQRMIDMDAARQVVLILDTLKKFTDVMDKSAVSEFNKLCRRFVSKGGTFIALAHTNKSKNARGEWVPGGTSDTTDDADSAWILDTKEDSNHFKTATFINIKHRGAEALRARFRFSARVSIPFVDRLNSVRYLGKDDELSGSDGSDEFQRESPAQDTDEQLIALVKESIRSGVTIKTSLIKCLTDQPNMTRKKAEKLIEKYTGTDPSKHHWNYTIGQRNAHIFSLLESDDLEL